MLIHLLFLSTLSYLFDQGHAAQPGAPKPYQAPLRDLKFGQLNFLHTTDTHGWHAGHLLEASYSADWGDYIDFSGRLRERLENEGKDLLLVDTGDRIEGNGLYDASSPRGKYTFDIFKQQHIDLICSGNHELYKATSANDEFNITVPAYRESYLASNLDIYDPQQHKFVPLAQKYKKFATPQQGLQIMSFGFIYNFLRNDNNTRVQPVEDAIKEAWFQHAIRDTDVDLFVVIGHSAVRSAEFDAVHKAIREVQWDTPIQFFGGHFHIRDYRKYDSKAYGLASGRFMETIGFQAIDGISPKHHGLTTDAIPSFFRRYIDNNLFSFYSHSNHTSSTFHTSAGKHVSAMISKSRRALGLDHVYGCAPRDLWMARAPYPANDSIYTWLEEEVLPAAANDSDRIDHPRLILLNTGAIRFDIFKGAFTKDSTYIVSPFTSTFKYIADIPYGKAKQLLAILNSAGQILAHWQPEHPLDASDLAPPMQRCLSRLNKGQPSSGDSQLLQHRSDRHQHPLVASAPSLKPGYTTSDDLGNDGDDTLHSPIDFYRVPNVIQSTVNTSSLLVDDDVKVDVVFNEFIQPYMLIALRFVGEERSDADVKSYMGGKSFTNLLAEWIEDHWSKDC
jgi:hypothetical protein